MIIFEAVIEAIHLVFTPSVIYWLLAGIFIGVGVGAIPGLGSATGIALMLPIAYFLNTPSALGLIVGLYKGAIFGGSIAAISFATPGTPGAAATVEDGYSLTQAGEGKKALDIALFASVTGDTLSDIFTILLAPAMVAAALLFGPAERFLLLVLAFVLIGTLAGKRPVKGLFGAAIGMLLATVGRDAFSFSSRFTFGFWWLRDGIEIIPFVIGLFAVAQVLEEICHFRTFDKIKSFKEIKNHFKVNITGKSGLTFREYLWCWKEMLTGTAIGSLVGLLPGLGATVGAYLSYAVSRNFKRSEKDNKITLALKGVAAAESGNNATVGPTLLPLLAFGIPGSVSAALLGSVLILHGTTPSPRMFELYPHVVYSLFLILLLGNVANLFLGRFVSRFYAYIGYLPKSSLLPFIVLMAILGTYVSRNNHYDVIIMLLIGLLGYFLKLIEVPIAPVVMTFILTPMIETTLRRALVLAKGQINVLLFSSSLSIGLISAILIVCVVIFKFKTIE